MKEDWYMDKYSSRSGSANAVALAGTQEYLLFNL